MPTQHVAKAAAALLAASAAVLPAMPDVSADVTPNTSFVEVLAGPEMQLDYVGECGPMNGGCSDY